MNPTDIEGWMSEAELVWLEEQAKLHTCIYEFGSYLGRSTMALARSCPGVVIAVDSWQPKFGGDATLERFRQNLSDFIASETVIPLRIPTKSAYRVDGRVPDMVFIDASHDYGSVVEDIITATELMGGKGLLCGHDHWNHWPDVELAVKDLVPGYAVARGTSIWYKELGT